MYVRIRNTPGIAGAAALCLLAACGGGGGGASEPEPQPPPPPDWFSPACDTVTGPPIASYSPDAGITIVPNAEPIEPDRANETLGLAAPHGYGGLLFATHASSSGLYMSTDAGCHWVLLLQVDSGGFFDLVANQTRGFVWQSEGGGLLRIEPDGSIDSLDVRSQHTFHATTAADPDALYALDRDGNIWRGAQQGDAWMRQGTRPPTPRIPQQFYINPRDSLHFVVTGSRGELAVSFDGGNTWDESVGIVRDADTGTSRAVAFASDGLIDEIYVNGTRAYRDEDGIIFRSDRFIARSEDGGLTLEDIVLDNDNVRFGNAASLATRPGVAGEVLFTGFDCPFHPPRLFHYRASDDTVTIITYEPDETRGFHSILFHPTDPDILYVGHQAIGGCPQ